MEPYNLRTWRISLPSGQDGIFHTCARPGRSEGQDKQVQDSVVSEWVRGLPPGHNKVIISLLGRKKDRRKLSEFSYYWFCGGWDTPEERGGRLSFQEWLDEHHGDLNLTVREHPSYDYDCPRVRPYALRAIKEDFLTFLPEGRTIIVMDSGGAGRTGKVAKYLNATEIPLSY